MYTNADSMLVTDVVVNTAVTSIRSSFSVCSRILRPRTWRSKWKDAYTTSICHFPPRDPLFKCPLTVFALSRYLEQLHLLLQQRSVYYFRFTLIAMLYHCIAEGLVASHWWRVHKCSHAFIGNVGSWCNSQSSTGTLARKASWIVAHRSGTGILECSPYCCWMSAIWRYHCLRSSESDTRFCFLPLYYTPRNLPAPLICSVPKPGVACHVLCSATLSHTPGP